MKKPDFFIVGAPKSGTTALYSYLKQHPQVYLPKKELYYFCRDLTFRTPPVSEDIYLSYYKDARSQKAVGDASVYYLLSPGAAQKIKDFNSAARIIIMLRNPVEMVYSLYAENLSNGDETMEDFEAALDAESGRKLGKLVPPRHNCPQEGLYYSEVAKYYEQVQRYKSVFAEAQIHIILFDDFKAGTEKEYKKVLKFLHLEEIMPVDFKVVNPASVARSKTYLNFLLDPPDFIKASGRALFPHHSRRREWLMDRLWSLNAKQKRRSPMPGKVKQRLLDIYKEDIEKLGKFLNRDLSEWTKI